MSHTQRNEAYHQGIGHCGTNKTSGWFMEYNLLIQRKKKKNMEWWIRWDDAFRATPCHRAVTRL